ncbi:hypothetical protein DFQ27_008309 [Actinomortierella ambigua]|uniref:Uncharacterized protein n=1 Tax=Actinomortierella ambigua TaxID=1343610 RepID=A0A9P6TYZ9_9FUNG|nr:hypothetical protein DFQ27_008309 [Actinomortierella ambigua]
MLTADFAKYCIPAYNVFVYEKISTSESTATDIVGETCVGMLLGTVAGFLLEFPQVRDTPLNLLIGNDREVATLRIIYKGALGRGEPLDITVKLKGLSVIEALTEL